jgi:hypothetical protein
MERKCKCGETLIPHKKWFQDVIIHKCPKYNIFNKKNHSISREYFAKVDTLKMSMK